MSYDAIILGAGHNGLVLQAYLAKAGLKTICLERNAVAGGGLRTIEWPVDSGFNHNTHAFFLRGITHFPWYRDLELARHGAEFLTPDLNVTMLTQDDRSLDWWTDFSKTIESFAAFSERDAATLQQWRDDFRPIVDNILLPESAAPPLHPDERREKLKQTREGRLLLETSALSPIEFVKREFENPAVQAALLFFNGLREVDLREPGFGHHIPGLLAADRYAQLCVGGSARLADALINSVTENGGEIRCDAKIHRIIVENGTAAGVELEDGEQIRAARLVASSLNPKQTFVDLLEPNEWTEKAGKFQFNLLAPLFALHLNVREAPVYKNDAFMTILGLDDSSQFEEIVAAHEAGRIPKTRVMWGSTPSKFDPTQAPENHHTAFMWEKLPFAVDWENESDAHAERILDLWSSYTKNDLRDSILDQFHQSPTDIARELPNMQNGDLLVGAFSNGQVGYDRPFRGAGHYRTCIDRLYLCGSSCHPGGNVTGLPGYNAAKTFLATL